MQNSLIFLHSQVCLRLFLADHRHQLALHGPKVLAEIHDLLQLEHHLLWQILMLLALFESHADFDEPVVELLSLLQVMEPLGDLLGFVGT